MCHKTLSEDYTFLDKIDLQNNKKQFWLVQGIGLILMLIMFVGGYFIDRLTFVGEENYTITIIALKSIIF